MHQTRTSRINPFSLTIAGLTCLLAVQMIVNHAAAPAAAAPSGAAIPVVVGLDLERVLNTIDARAAAKKRLEEKVQELEAQRKIKLQEAEKLEQSLDMLPKGTPKYDEVEKAYIHAKSEAKAMLGFARQKIDDMAGDSLRRLYKDVKTALGAFADDRGFDIIMLNDSVREIEQAGENAVTQQISARRILYARPSADVTDDFIKWMNQRDKVAAGG